MAQTQFVPARGCIPVVELGSVVAQVPGGDGKADFAFLARVQCHTFWKPRSDLRHPAARRRGAGGVADIQLHHLGAAQGAAVAHLHPQRDVALLGPACQSSRAASR